MVLLEISHALDFFVAYYCGDSMIVKLFVYLSFFLFLFLDYFREENKRNNISEFFFIYIFNKRLSENFQGRFLSESSLSNRRNSSLLFFYQNKLPKEVRKRFLRFFYFFCQIKLRTNLKLTKYFSFNSNFNLNHGFQTYRKRQ